MEFEEGETCDGCGYKNPMQKLVDDRYTYNLCHNCIIFFIGRCLPSHIWKILIQKFPDSFYLHGDFYDEGGYAVQSAFHNHILLFKDYNQK